MIAPRKDSSKTSWMSAVPSVESDSDVILASSSQMYDLLLNTTPEEANAMVRRCQGQGWLAWKRLSSSLNPRMLTSGIKAISMVRSPWKITKAAKADREFELWEDRMAKLNSEYGQQLSNKVKVAVPHAILRKDLEERVLDECAVNRGETPEKDAGILFSKVKVQINTLRRAGGR